MLPYRTGQHIGPAASTNQGGQTSALGNGEAEFPEQPTDGRLAAAEIPGSERPLPRQERVRYTDDGLRVIGLAVVNQQVRTGAVAAVLDEELVLAEPVVLGVAWLRAELGCAR
jgi:hypothetical protein